VGRGSEAAGSWFFFLEEGDGVFKIFLKILTQLAQSANADMGRLGTPQGIGFVGGV